MAGLYQDAAKALGVTGEPAADQGFKADDAISALTGANDPRYIPDSEPVKAEEKPEKPFRQRWVEGQLGGIEGAGSLASSLFAAPIGAAAGLIRGITGGKYGTAEGAREAQARAAEVAQSLTYRPRTEAGQEGVEQVGKAFEASKLGGLGPTEGVSLAGVLAGPRAVKPVPIRTAAPQMARASVGDAGAQALEQARATVAGSHPELIAAVEKAGTQVNPVVVARHAEAYSLPVPIRLTPGQATQDVTMLSQEMNKRGKYQPLANRFNEQNKQLIENTDAIREKAAPDVYATTQPEIGELVIDAYKNKDAAANANISQLYRQLRDANGGTLPLDGNAFKTAADAALHKQLLFDHVPPEIRKTIDRLASDRNQTGQMTFENFESLRTNLARIQRSQTADGNAKAAAGVIRNVLEDMPMPPGAEHLKPLADAARAAAKERFAAIEADPAYKAVVTGKASADKFISKFVIGADLKNVQTMKANLSHDPVAQQALAAGTVDHVKGSALRGGENFSQAGYNKALEALRPKLGVIFEPGERQNLETLGKVARYTQAQPRGSFVNVSNTATAMIAEHAKAAAEGATNVAFKGVPVGTWIRRVGGRYLEQRELDKMLEPAAGIRLKDVAR